MPFSNSNAAVHIDRLGLGFSNQLAVDIPAISFKIQKSSAFALGGMFAYSSNNDGGGYAAGLKIYRIFFDEPFLNFYGSILGALLNKNVLGQSSADSGFQFDFTLGSEFTFRGIESLGFSLEFGLSLNKLKDFVAETVGDHFIKAGVHFYL